MERITITLPPEMKEYVESQVASGSFGNTSEYIRDLIRHDRQNQAMEKVEALIMEGINSGPPAPLTPDFIERIKTEIRKKASERQKTQ